MMGNQLEFDFGHVYLVDIVRDKWEEIRVVLGKRAKTTYNLLIDAEVVSANRTMVTVVLPSNRSYQVEMLNQVRRRGEIMAAMHKVLDISICPANMQFVCKD
jgi:hypothetical protein